MFDDTIPPREKQGEKRLIDERFNWRSKKGRTMRTAYLYGLAGYEREANRAAACAAWLQFQVADVDGKEVRDLAQGNFCQLRLCPMCTARRAKRASYLLSKVMDTAQSRNRGLQYVFLTLTMRNVDGPGLKQALTDLSKSWYRLQDQRRVERAQKGWFRAIEITHNRRDGTFHPHIHAILAVEPLYFLRKGGLYLSHEDWVTRWKKALRVDYDPSVRIQATGAKDKKRMERAAADEAAKYATKDQEFLGRSVSEDEAVMILTTYTEALRRKRLTAFGGILKDIARELKADDLEDGDLVHIEEDSVREDLAVLMETYGWNFGAKDYVLLSVTR